MLSSSLDFVPLINSSLQSITTTESLCSREQASQGRDGQPPPCRRSPVKLLKFWQDKLAIWWILVRQEACYINGPLLLLLSLLWRAWAANPLPLKAARRLRFD